MPASLPCRIELHLLSLSPCLLHISTVQANDVLTADNKSYLENNRNMPAPFHDAEEKVLTRPENQGGIPSYYLRTIDPIAMNPMIDNQSDKNQYSV
ncbi:hypothetical protein F4860DRAFT_459200 [Xylaria cubensis]|nr:hypothetical protein F4860DRAFT_459200 [Xylaria cubensis]